MSDLVLTQKEEVRTLAREMVRSYRDAIMYYCDRMGMGIVAASEKARTLTEEHKKVILAKPSEEVSWHCLPSSTLYTQRQGGASLVPLSNESDAVRAERGDPVEFVMIGSQESAADAIREHERAAVSEGYLALRFQSARVLPK